MNKFFLRPTVEGDIEQIIKIWSEAFGDSEEFILSLKENCRLIQNGVCAECDGKGRAFMFSFDGLEFDGKAASYIYGLCTQPEYRQKGIGKALAIYAAQQAANRGAELVFLRPADKGLEAWYAATLNARPFAPIETKKIEPSLPAKFKANEISADEYFEKRLITPWKLSAEILSAESIVHRFYGGAFLQCGECCVCAEKCGDGIYLREIVGGDSSHAFSAVAEKFGVKEVFVPQLSSEGIPLMFIPPYDAKNISEVPLMPYTLD